MGDSQKKGKEKEEGIIDSLGFSDTQKSIIKFLATVILSVVISIVLFNYQISTTTAQEKRSLANGFLIDIQNTNETVRGVILAVEDKNDPDYNRVRYLKRPFYSDWKMYYSNRQDIIKFEPVLAKKLYNFYDRLLMAEETRNLINNYDSDNPPDPNNAAAVQNHFETKKKMYDSMITDIYKSYSEIPDLKIELEKVTHS